MERLEINGLFWDRVLSTSEEEEEEEEEPARNNNNNSGGLLMLRDMANPPAPVAGPLPALGEYSISSL